MRLRFHARSVLRYRVESARTPREVYHEIASILPVLIMPAPDFDYV